MVAVPDTPESRAVSVLPGIRPEFWLLHSLGWTGYGALHYLSALSYGKHWAYFVVSFGSAAMGFVLTLGLRFLLKRFWGIAPPRFAVVVAIGVLAVATVWALLYVEMAVPYCLWLHPPSECTMKMPWGYIGYIGSLLYVCLSWTGLYLGIKYYRQMRAQTESALKANAMAHQAQLKMLRYQLNPHFLFNTLNAISTLVLEKDTGTANRMVTSLSAFLRHSLDSDPMQRVTLKQELDALNLYLGIEKVRFAERLGLRSSIDEQAYRALVPSLLLQPLAENSIKHAISQRIEGGVIEIEARVVDGRLEIAVSDSGPGCDGLPSGGGLPQGSGVGLANISERLRVLYGERSSFSLGNRPGGGCQARIVLPFETALSN
ncbi:MAG: histidine kinase [Pseudoxanthomonas sp.]|nr:histidine kinase [Pseudoxanthomonas sp.]